MKKPVCPCGKEIETNEKSKQILYHPDCLIYAYGMFFRQGGFGGKRKYDDAYIIKTIKERKSLL
mgnify:CR=1 FL=1